MLPCLARFPRSLLPVQSYLLYVRVQPASTSVQHHYIQCSTETCSFLAE